MKKLIVAAAALALAVPLVRGLRSPSSSESADEVASAANRLLVDRVWIDHVPHSDTDTIQVFAALSDQALGVFQAASQWRGSTELFRFEAHGAELRILYPQTGERETVRAKARRCEERGMDYCLELDGASRGVKRYYSRKGWEIGRGTELPAVVRRVEVLRTQLVAP